jgi:hypothetical protein
MVANHSEVPIFLEFVTEAFGADESVWKAGSPATENWHVVWRAGRFPRLVVLGCSDGDERRELGRAVKFEWVKGQAQVHETVEADKITALAINKRITMCIYLFSTLWCYQIEQSLWGNYDCYTKSDIGSWLSEHSMILHTW